MLCMIGQFLGQFFCPVRIPERGDQMAERKIRAGYYRRYDGKVVYVISLATDADTGEESVIWTTYPFAAVPRYYTSSKSPSALLSK